jgi:uncharacterized 2Fe-2S/4Fe-4S cluster protein (DUF4445 family)
MPILDIHLGLLNEKLEFKSGKSVKQLLDMTRLRVRSGCRGIGACGLCKVRILSTNLPAATLADELHLSQNDLTNGIRLACQCYPSEDMSVEVIAVAPMSQWHSDTIGEYACAFTPKKQCGYFLAIDIGTTHLGIAVVDANGVLVADRKAINPQVFMGADVLSRIVSAVGSEESAELLWEMVVATLSDGIADILKREGIGHHKMQSCEIVGNTAMLSLLCRHNYHLLLEPAYWMLPVDTSIDTETNSKLLQKFFASSITIWPSFAGFVGSDIAAGILHSKLMRQSKPSMLIDFGTNSEIALWDGKTLFLTSAAGGPAFEASGVGCGIPAGRGAIFRASKESENWRFNTIGDTRPEGVCGSGLIDLIACLVHTKEISPIGVFKESGQHSWRLPIENEEIFLSKRDIDLFARAKAAISVGIVALCEAANIEIDELDNLFIGGDFGKYLDIENAISIGLIPQIPVEKVKTMGNTALLGCIDLAISDEAKEKFWAAQKAHTVINLASYENFDEVFIQNLYLRSMNYGK